MKGWLVLLFLGGIFEGLVGLSARYWKRFLTPVVSACVVIAIGLSLLSVGMDSWGMEAELLILVHGIIWLLEHLPDCMPGSQIFTERGI